MAARSPVLIQSSSPNLHRFPSTTPHKNETGKEPLNSSSPDLPHPSAFFKAHTSGLLSGSKAREIPQGATAGFASAASLLRIQTFDPAVHGADEGIEDVGPTEGVKKAHSRETAGQGKAAVRDNSTGSQRAKSRSDRSDQKQADGNDTGAAQLRTQGTEILPKTTNVAAGKLKKIAKSSRSAPSRAGLSLPPLEELAPSAQLTTTRQLRPSVTAVSVGAGDVDPLELAASRRTSISLSELDFNPKSPGSRRTASPLGRKASEPLHTNSGSSREMPKRKTASKEMKKSALPIPKATAPGPASHSGSRRPSICFSEYTLQPGDRSDMKSASPPAAETLGDGRERPAVHEANVAPSVVSPSIPCASHTNPMRRSPAEFVSKYQYGGGTSPPLSAAVPQRPTIRLPDFADESRVILKELAMTTESLCEQPPVVKAPRKRAPKSRQPNASGPAPRSKKFTNSASIILNSDEPDIDADGRVDGDANFGPAAPTLPVPAELAAKPKKATRKSKAARKIEDESHAADKTAIAPPQTVHGVANDVGAQGEFDAHRNAWSQSVYFAKDDTAICQALPLATTEESLQSMFVVDGTRTDATSPSPAPQPPFRRRRSWTPARNTEIPNADTPPTLESRLLESPVAGPSLTALVSGFEYNAQANSDPAHGRTSTGEAALKKRRIELAHETAAGAAVRRVKGAAAPKRVKAVKKKPQTITELATKAYRAEPEPVTAQPTVSEFFAPQKEPPITNEDIDPCEAIAEKPAKAKKTRKRRIKVGGDPEALAAMAQKATKVQKAPKVKKVKFNGADLAPPLLSPQRARAVEVQQGFLFGTSSQLAVDDSPTFVQQMQAALRESEVTSLQARFSPRRRSCVKVPSAPHGTSLSVGQADRDLWCTASRDHAGAVLAVTERRKRAVVKEHPAHCAEDAPVLRYAEALQVPGPLLDIEQSAEHMPDVPPDVEEVVDLCATSPTDESDVRGTGSAVHDLPEPGNDDAGDNAPGPEPKFSDDSWMLLSSDGAGRIEVHVSAAPRSMSPAGLRTFPALSRSVTAPTRMRPALQALDGNASVLAQTSPARFLQSRAFTGVASPPAQKCPRGRPRKDASSIENIPPAQKRRGRPPKSAATSMLTEVMQSIPAMPASQQSAASDFVNIDEIYDSDPSTPSPPRRRAASTPPSVRPLELELCGSPSPSSKGPAVVSTMLKFGDPQWTSISAVLFPQIAKAVRNAPPSNDKATLSWHEKILLYDPIVLEDFTGWLNGQGLGVETRKVKAKPKKKSKKKKDDDQPAEPVDDPVEYELCREEVKPWMVQKWCESKSICCLWKEGMRGGVKVHY